MREAGQNVAALWASLAAIYQRFGYAMTTVMRTYAVDTDDIRFFDGDGGNGRVVRVDAETARDIGESPSMPRSSPSACATSTAWERTG